MPQLLPSDVSDDGVKMRVKMHQDLIQKLRMQTIHQIPSPTLNQKRKKRHLKNLLKAKALTKRKKALKLKMLPLMTIQMRRSRVLRLNQMTIQMKKNLNNSNRIKIYNHEY